MLWPFFFAKNGHVFNLNFMLCILVLKKIIYIYLLTLFWSGRFFHVFFGFFFEKNEKVGKKVAEKILFKKWVKKRPDHKSLAIFVYFLFFVMNYGFKKKYQKTCPFFAKKNGQTISRLKKYL
tara:strand:+ start:1667 stop:2032 length:366 start_codon:yes stop_codon:yes gene_type:complete